jgi:hypothetical protein
LLNKIREKMKRKIKILAVFVTAVLVILGAFALAIPQTEEDSSTAPAGSCYRMCIRAYGQCMAYCHPRPSCYNLCWQDFDRCLSTCSPNHYTPVVYC